MYLPSLVERFSKYFQDLTKCGFEVQLHRIIYFDFQEDKSTLSKYKDAVEKRLHILEEQGYVYAYETISN